MLNRHTLFRNCRRSLRVRHRLSQTKDMVEGSEGKQTLYWFLSQKINVVWLLGALITLAWLLIGIFSADNPVPFFEEESLIVDEPDAFVVDGIHTTYGEDGNIESVLRSSQVKHYPETNKGRLVSPRLELYQAGELRWTTTSEQGEFDVNNDTLTLTGGVTVFGQTNNGTPIYMKTESVKYANESRVIHTDYLVKINSQVSEISANGMTAYVDERTVQLLANVKGSYEPKSSR